MLYKFTDNVSMRVIIKLFLHFMDASVCDNFISFISYSLVSHLSSNIFYIIQQQHTHWVKS